MSIFKLQIKELELIEYANKYVYSDDSIVQEIGVQAQKKQFLNKKEFLKICEWKTPRSKPLCKSNSEEYIKEVTSIAFTTNSDRVRVEILTLLKGVGWPTASAILHFCHLEPYPILDFRALFSLGLEVPNQYDYKFWKEYVTECRILSEKFNVNIRTIDRALWQYSKEYNSTNQ